MGVTIHFEGCLRDETAYEAVIKAAEAIAVQQGWDWQPINEAERSLSGCATRRIGTT